MLKNNDPLPNMFVEIKLKQNPQSLILSLTKTFLAYIPYQDQLVIIALKNEGQYWKQYYRQHLNYNQSYYGFRLICFNKNDNQVLIHSMRKNKIYYVDLKEQSFFDLSKIFAGKLELFFCYKEYCRNDRGSQIDCSFNNQFILIKISSVYLLLDVKKVRIRAKFQNDGYLEKKITFFTSFIAQIIQRQQIIFVSIKTLKKGKRICLNGQSSSMNQLNINGEFIAYQQNYDQYVGIVWNLINQKQIRRMTLKDQNLKNIDAFDRFSLQKLFANSKPTYYITNSIFFSWVKNDKDVQPRIQAILHNLWTIRI